MRSCLKAISWHATIGASSLSARPDEPGYLQVVRQVVALPGCPVADSCPVAGRTGRSLSFTGRPLPIPMAYPGFRQNTITSFLSRPFSSRQQGTKVCRYNRHSAGSLGWPFPVLKYEYIFQIKYTEAILSNSTGKLLWFEITKMLIAV